MKSIFQTAIDVAWRHSNGDASDAELARAGELASEHSYNHLTYAISYLSWPVGDAVLAVVNESANAMSILDKNEEFYLCFAEQAVQATKMQQILDAGEWVED